MRQRLWQVIGVFAVIVSAGAWRGTSAQGQGPDVLAALLVEIRGLRASMEQMASAGPRIQLATARLQLQEQRINNLLRRLESTRDNIATGQQELLAQQERLRQVEQELKDRDIPAEANAIASSLKQAIASRTMDLQRLQAEEAQLSQDIVAEQGRWNEINQRLDELDRALTKK